MSCKSEFRNCERISDEMTIEARRARYASGMSLIAAAKAAGIGQVTMCHYENIDGEFPNMPKETYDLLMEVYKDANNADRQRYRYFKDDRIDDEQTKEMIAARKRGGIPRRAAAEALGVVNQNCIYNWEQEGCANAPKPAYETLMAFYADKNNWSKRALKNYEKELAGDKAPVESDRKKPVVRRCDRVLDIDAAKVLRDMRDAAGMTLEEAAKLSKTSVGTIANWERAKSAPSKTTFDYLCAIYLMRAMRNRAAAQKLYDEFVA